MSCAVSEIVFYAVFPIAVLLSSSASTRSIAWFLLAALAAQHLTMSILWPFDIRQLWSNYVTPLVFAPYFVMGILIHRLDASVQSMLLVIFTVSVSYMTNEYFEKPMRRYFRRSGASREGAIVVRTWLSETFMRGAGK